MLKKILGSKVAHQTLFLFTAQIFGMVVGFVSNMLLAKQMGAVDFGIYSLSLAIIIFISIFFEFGYFSSASKMLANNHDINLEKKIFGVSIIIVCVIATLFLLFTLIVSFLLDIVFNDKVGHIIRISSFISWSFVIPFVVFLFILFIFEGLTPLNALLSFSLSYALAFVIYGCTLQPNFSGFSEILTTINLENKRYGIHVYVGRVIDVSTYNIDRLLIGYFIGAKDVGFYGLANSMATPINSLSNAMSSTMFKTLANSSKIPPAVLKANLAWVFLAFVLANILGYLIINFYLKEEYSDVLLLLLLMSIAVCFQALYQPYNAWINGHGYGKELKKANIKMTIMTALSSILLVPIMGAIGACVSSMISNLYSLFLYTKIYYAKI